MPLLESAALGLGTLLAKEVAKALLGKDSGLQDAANVLIDVLKGQGEKSLADAKDARKIETLSREIAQRTLMLFEREGSGLNEEDRKRIKAEVAATIALHPLTPQFIISHNNDAQRVAQALLAEREPQVAQARLSASEHSLYERMVTECVRGISNVIISTDSFVPHMLGESLRRQEEFQDAILHALVLRMKRERDEAYTFEEQRFAGEYCLLAKTKFEKFELFGIRDVEDQVGERRRLSEAYVSLSVRELPNSKDRANKIVLVRPPHKFLVEQAVALSPRLVITGVAGGGKSTLVKYLAMKTAEGNLPTELIALQNAVPFVLRLRHYPDEAFPSVENWLKMEFSQLREPPREWIRGQLESGRALVMVDGVDEMPQSKREAMLDTLRQLITLYPAARYIISSRPEALEDWPAWREWMEAEGFAHVKIEPMSAEQRTALVTRWFAEYQKTVYDPESLRRLSNMDDRLNKLLDERLPLGRLTINPLMCAMVCALYETYGDSLPQRRTDLYEKCIEMALTLRDERRSVPSTRAVSLKICG